MTRPQILFLDAYDSFTNNIVSLIETELDATVTTIHIDSDVGQFETYIQNFDAIVAGPGPGHPGNLKDVGLVAELWNLKDPHIRPVLGVCLGFQSLVYAFGGTIERLSGPRHGISTEIKTLGTGLFDDLHLFSSIQYHSLRGSLSQQEVSWRPSTSCPELQPLAWDLPARKEDGPILMAVSHVSKPFWGIQFHPESICSSMEAKKVVRNWWALCQKWHQTHPKNEIRAIKPSIEPAVIHSLLEMSSGRSSMTLPRSPRSDVSLSSMSSYSTSRASSPPPKSYHCQSLETGGLNIPKIVECLELGQKELIVLDSEKRLMQDLGRYSIISLLEPDTTRLCYQVGSKTLRSITGDSTTSEDIGSPADIFSYLKQFLHRRKITNGHPVLPFWGGLVGYITYEACLETINVTAKPIAERDDIYFAFVERSIVLDHVEGTLYVQSIVADDNKWIESTISALREASKTSSAIDATPISVQYLESRLPSEKDYKSKIQHCQGQIRAGNSYEICLTNQATFKTPKTSTPWEKYLTLRALNPAPFASYINTKAVTILSTSPERFMHWSRPTPTSSGSIKSTVQFRPIKGTVQKVQTLPDGTTRSVSLAEAQKLLSTPKEKAENLMIVDLIRHDLHGVIGSGNVRVPSLMQIEEYSTVYQLVSVIEGDLYTNTTTSKDEDVSGIDVLASSLPPGSMTGAPKKRSCEILAELEDENRSIYSGVIGYMCVGGGGDFSVTIRTLFSWRDEEDERRPSQAEGNETGDRNGEEGVSSQAEGNGDGNEEIETWRIGAGGAITILSDEQGEWEEMLGKMGSTRRLFQE